MKNEVDVKNSLVVTTASGKVERIFCTEQEAKALLEKAGESHASAVSWTGSNAKLLFDVSPNFQERVRSTEHRFKRELQVLMFMTEYGIPDEYPLRANVLKTVNASIDFVLGAVLDRKIH